MTPAARLEREVLDWLGLLPESVPPNDEPDYEARLRKLGAHLHAKNLGADECLVALALHYLTLSDEEPTRRHEYLGRARQLISGARTLATADPVLFEAIGRGLEAQGTSS